jgi:hypothetical protein
MDVDVATADSMLVPWVTAVTAAASTNSSSSTVKKVLMVSPRFE